MNYSFAHDAAALAQNFAKVKAGVDKLDNDIYKLRRSSNHLLGGGSR